MKSGVSESVAQEGVHHNREFQLSLVDEVALEVILKGRKRVEQKEAAPRVVVYPKILEEL